MAMTYARAIICGRATKDVETRTVPGKNGEFLASTLNLAVDRAWNLPKAENGENATDFYRIELTGPQATYSQYVKKGDVVTVIALPYTGKPYTNKNNIQCQETIYKGEEIFIFGKPIPQNNGNGGGYQNQGYQNQPQNQGYQNQPRPNYQQAPPQQGYQQAPPQQGYQQAPPQQGYQQAPPQQGYQQAPPQQGYQQTPPQQGYQQTPPQDNPAQSQGFNGMAPPEGFAPIAGAMNDPFGLGG